VGRRVKTTVHYEEESTALDDDLLEAKDADELDDNGYFLKYKTYICSNQRNFGIHIRGIF
jgi:hypothetical protein